MGQHRLQASPAYVRPCLACAVKVAVTHRSLKVPYIGFCTNARLVDARFRAVRGTRDSSDNEILYCFRQAYSCELGGPGVRWGPDQVAVGAFARRAVQGRDRSSESMLRCRR